MTQRESGEKKKCAKGKKLRGQSENTGKRNGVNKKKERERG